MLKQIFAGIAIAVSVVATNSAISQDASAPAINLSETSTSQMSAESGRTYFTCMMAMAIGTCTAANSPESCDTAVRSSEPFCTAQLTEDAQRQLNAARATDESASSAVQHPSRAYNLLKSTRQHLLKIYRSGNPK